MIPNSLKIQFYNKFKKSSFFTVTVTDYVMPKDLNKLPISLQNNIKL